MSPLRTSPKSLLLCLLLSFILLALFIGAHAKSLIAQSSAPDQVLENASPIHILTDDPSAIGADHETFAQNLFTELGDFFKELGNKIDSSQDAHPSHKMAELQNNRIGDRFMNRRKTNRSAKRTTPHTAFNRFRLFRNQKSVRLMRNKQEGETRKKVVQKSVVSEEPFYQELKSNDPDVIVYNAPPVSNEKLRQLGMGLQSSVGSTMTGNKRDSNNASPETVLKTMLDILEEQRELNKDRINNVDLSTLASAYHPHVEGPKNIFTL
mmetsp:Transcript_11368/g.42656  ORF Transcript_11368/g.42656 Transcript_11368/m.42656 type:complete len:266 (-) Transcript_11368:2968-3765(-)